MRTKVYVSIISSMIIPHKNETILDIGTGTGQIANKLCQQKRGLIIGLDIDKRAFEQRQHLFLPIVADAHHMPFKNEAFDTTLIISCLEHSKNHQKQ